MLVIFYFILLSTLMTSCEINEPFTEEELKRASVYSEGDQFTMATNYGDTLTFTVDSKTVEKKGRGIFANSYQELEYNLSINSTRSGQHSGRIYARSLKDFKNLLIYNLEIKKKYISGGFDLSTATDTVVINGITYHNSNCNSLSCFSLDKGFLKFTKGSDTLVLLP